MKNGDLNSGRTTARPPMIVAGILEVVADAIEVAGVTHFVTRQKFVVDREGELPISYVGDDFASHFLPLTETDVAGATLLQYRLMKGTVDEPIFAALGGEKQARIPLAHLFAFLKTADRSRWFFAYVADATGRLWAIDTYWRDRGWDLEAYSVTYPRGWRAGGCVVSGPV
ncbi:hypothetical protein [Sphingomonas oryzagri]|jgi:hypothetical protein|uniref:Uncharacterized protein n=1 Tax=Sphingomonas oryzagri TaxID=3042314 RepID=A0ABT6MXH7_9SPHN|nr:hypothetical protein [Sphingomonas oryzagri]MDH7637702.1 hypothetical protein [Sphingomonas oryzagri]